VLAILVVPRTDHPADAPAAHDVTGLERPAGAAARAAGEVGALGRPGCQADRFHQQPAVTGLRHRLLAHAAERLAEGFGRRRRAGHAPDAVDGIVRCHDGWTAGIQTGIIAPGRTMNLPAHTSQPASPRALRGTPAHSG